MLDHWQPGLFQTHLRQCQESAWQVPHVLDAPVPFPLSALSAAASLGNPGAHSFQMPVPEHWLMLTPPWILPILPAELSRAPPDPLPTPL